MKNLLIITLALATISCNHNPQIGKDLSGTYNYTGIVCRDGMNRFEKIAKIEPKSGTLKIDRNSVKSKFVGKNFCSFETESSIVFNAQTGLVKTENIQYNARISDCYYEPNTTKEDKEAINPKMEVISDLKFISSQTNSYIMWDKDTLLIMNLHKDNKVNIHKNWDVFQKSCYDEFTKK